MLGKGKKSETLAHSLDNPADIHVLSWLIVREHVCLQRRSHPVPPVPFGLIGMNEDRVALGDRDDQTGDGIWLNERAVHFYDGERVVVEREADG